jgi:hypothetical protein
MAKQLDKLQYLVLKTGNRSIKPIVKLTFKATILKL